MVSLGVFGVATFRGGEEGGAREGAKKEAAPGRSLRGAAIANVRVYVNACALSPSSTCESGRSSEGSGKWSLSFSRAGEGKKEKK